MNEAGRAGGGGKVPRPLFARTKRAAIACSASSVLDLFASPLSSHCSKGDMEGFLGG